MPNKYDDKQWWRDFFSSLQGQGEETLGKEIDYKDVPGKVVGAATKGLIPKEAITDYLDLPSAAHDTPDMAILRSLGRDVAELGSSFTSPLSAATLGAPEAPQAAKGVIKKALTKLGHYEEIPTTGGKSAFTTRGALPSDELINNTARTGVESAARSLDNWTPETGALKVKGWHATRNRFGGGDLVDSLKAGEPLGPDFHFGTEQAAVTRAAGFDDKPTRLVPIEAEYDKVYPYIVTDNVANDYYTKLGAETANYPVIPYKNDVEDPNSISWLGINPKNIKAKVDEAIPFVSSKELTPLHLDELEPDAWRKRINQIDRPIHEAHERALRYFQEDPTRDVTIGHGVEDTTKPPIDWPWKPKGEGEVGSVKLDALIPKRILNLIEGAGGKGAKLSGDTVSWIDAVGNKRSANITGRFGSRDVGTSPRQTGESLRQINEAPRQLGEDVKSLAADASGMSSEEIARPGVYYSIKRSGEPTYLGKKVDGPGTIIEVVPGKAPRIYQGSGSAKDLERFNLSATGQDIIDRIRSEQGAVGSNIGAGLPKKPKAGPKVISATALPEIDLPGRFKLQSKYNKQPITFASDFDQAAYTLASTSKPNQDLLAELMQQSGFDENTILQHGEKIANRVRSLGDKNLPIALKPRSVSVIGEGKPESTLKAIAGVPSAVKFSIDLPALRQSFIPNVMHPLKTGLPALKRGFGSYTEKGFRANAADMLENSPVHSILDTAAALGPTKAEKMYPNIEILKKLSVNDVPEYFTGTSKIKGTALGKYLTNPSERSYSMSQASSRGTEMDRLAKAAGTTIEDMARDPKWADELKSMVRLTNERTGHGPLGKLEPAGEALSYAFTAPRNTSSKLMRQNPLNYIPENLMRKAPGGDWLVNKGAASRYGSGVAYKDFLKDQGKMALLFGLPMVPGGALVANKAKDWLGDNASALMGVTGAGAKALGADVEPDPLATNFGIRAGNWKPDYTGGNLSVPRFMPRPFTEERTSGRGIPYGRRINAITGKPEMSNETNDIIRFFRSQLRPGIPAMLADKYLPPGGVNYLGEDISQPFKATEGRGPDIPGTNTPVGSMPYSRWIVQQFTPGFPSDTLDVARDNPKLLPLQIPLGAAGTGSSTYDPNAPKEYEVPTQKKKRGKKSSVGERIR